MLGDLVQDDFISQDSVVYAEQFFHLCSLVAMAELQSANYCFLLEGPGDWLLIHKPTPGN